VLKIKTILKEVLGNLFLTWTVARYDNKAAFQGHYFGLVWEIVNPLIQIGIYWFVFDAIRERAPVIFNGIEVPFLSWMLVGMSAWLFMNGATRTASKSVHNKIGLVSKMKFPMSVLPAMSIASKLTAYLVTVSIVIIILLFSGITPSIFWLQYIYYLFAMLTFLYFFALLNSTITVLFRDYQNLLTPFMRFMFFFSGPIWRMDEMVAIPDWFVRLMDLNPFSYIITGFRNTFLGGAFFWEHAYTTIFFWLLILLIAIISSHLHLKFRSKFIDLS